MGVFGTNIYAFLEFIYISAKTTLIMHRYSAGRFGIMLMFLEYFRFDFSIDDIKPILVVYTTN